MIGKLLTIKQLCDQLQVSRSTIDRWRKEEGLPFVKIEGSIRIEEEAFNEWYKAKIRRTH